MQDSTLEIVRTALKADGTIQSAHRARIIKLMRDGDVPQETTPAEPATPRILNRAEVARRFGRTTRFIDGLAQEGILKKIRMPGRVRAVGFLEEQVSLVLAGG